MLKKTQLFKNHLLLRVYIWHHGLYSKLQLQWKSAWNKHRNLNTRPHGSSTNSKRQKSWEHSPVNLDTCTQLGSRHSDWHTQLSVTPSLPGSVLTPDKTTTLASITTGWFFLLENFILTCKPNYITRVFLCLDSYIWCHVYEMHPRWAILWHYVNILFPNYLWENCISTHWRLSSHQNAVLFRPTGLST